MHDRTLTDADTEKGKSLIRFLNSSLHFADSRLLSWLYFIFLYQFISFSLRSHSWRPSLYFSGKYQFVPYQFWVFSLRTPRTYTIPFLFLSTPQSQASLPYTWLSPFLSLYFFFKGQIHLKHPYTHYPLLKSLWRQRWQDSSVVKWICSIPCTHMVEGEHLLQQAVSDLHLCAVVRKV